jgi:hypothetical protein
MASWNVGAFGLDGDVDLGDVGCDDAAGAAVETARVTRTARRAEPRDAPTTRKLASDGDAGRTSVVDSARRPHDALATEEARDVAGDDASAPAALPRAGRALGAARP